MKPSFHNSPELRFPLFNQEDEHGRYEVSLTLLCLSSLNLSDMKISKCKRAANKATNLFFVLGFMLAHVITVDTCAEDELDPDSDLRVNNTYSRTYRSKPIMKIHRPRYPNLDKFHQKLKRIVDRVRSLEQPGKFFWLVVSTSGVESFFFRGVQKLGEKLRFVSANRKKFACLPKVEVTSKKSWKIL